LALTVDIRSAAISSAIGGVADVTQLAIRKGVTLRLATHCSGLAFYEFTTQTSSIVEHCRVHRLAQVTGLSSASRIA
jgi:hypothetical protein